MVENNPLPFCCNETVIGTKVFARIRFRLAKKTAIKTVETEPSFVVQCTDCNGPKGRNGFVQIIYISHFQ